MKPLVGASQPWIHPISVAPGTGTRELAATSSFARRTEEAKGERGGVKQRRASAKFPRKKRSGSPPSSHEARANKADVSCPSHRLGSARAWKGKETAVAAFERAPPCRSRRVHLVTPPFPSPHHPPTLTSKGPATEAMAEGEGARIAEHALGRGGPSRSGGGEGSSHKASSRALGWSTIGRVTISSVFTFYCGSTKVCV